MSFQDWIKSFWKSEQQNWTFTRVLPPSGFVGPPNAVNDDTPIGPGSAYIRITMRSMMIEATQRLWNKFHAALYSHCTLPLRNGQTAEIQSVLSPQEFKNLEKGNLSRVLLRDKTVFGPVPYTGGALGGAFAVVAVKDEDLSGPFLDVLTTLAGAAGVSYMSAATPFIAPIKKGVELLTGSGNTTSAEIGIDREHQPPVVGWYVLLHRTAASVNSNELSLGKGNELLYQKKELTGIAYLVFSIDATPTRDDWAQIPELKDLYAQFTAAALANKQNESKEIVAQFRRRCLLCPELLAGHAAAVAKTVEDEMNQLFGGGPTGGGRGRGPRPLGELPVTF